MHPRNIFSHPAACLLPRAACLALLLTIGVGSGMSQKFDDRVEKFKLALVGRDKEGGSGGARLEGESLKHAVAYRKETLEKAAEALTTPDELSRALLLVDWPREEKLRPGEKPLPPVDFEKASRKVEEEVRKDMSRRFVKVVRASLSGKNVARVVATANLVGETIDGTSVLREERLELYDELSPLVKEVAALADSPEPRVQMAAAAALGAFPKSVQVVAPALQKLLDKDRPKETRRAAAEALLSLIQRSSGYQALKGSEPGIAKRESRSIPYRLSDDEVISSLSEVVPVVAAGVDDDVAIRRICVQAIYQGAQALAITARDLRVGFFVIEKAPPPRERKWSAAEKAAALELRRSIARERRKLMPALDAYRLQAAALAKAALDEDPQTRLDARRALGELSRARAFLDKRLEAVPERSDVADDIGKPEQKPDEDAKEDAKTLAADPLGEMLLTVGEKVVTGGFRDPKPAARRAALEAGELLGKAAVRFIPRIVEALEDKDPFCRWIAARTLGRLAPAKPEVVVPGLAKLVADDDLSPRLAAMTALTAYGPDAKDAVEALATMVGKGDVESRLGAMKAIDAIGRSASAAIPALGKALGETDARVRAEAARVLGRFGTAASSHADVLEKLTADPDVDVRRAASAALFSVTPP